MAQAMMSRDAKRGSSDEKAIINITQRYMQYIGERKKLDSLLENDNVMEKEAKTQGYINSLTLAHFSPFPSLLLSSFFLNRYPSLC